MLSTIVRFSVRYYGIVIALSILLLAYGVFRLSNAGLDIFPEFSPKQVIIQTESQGFSAEQVEVLVTQPIESAISGLNRAGLFAIRIDSGLVDCYSDLCRKYRYLSKPTDGQRTIVQCRDLVARRCWYARSRAAGIVFGNRSNHWCAIRFHGYDGVTKHCWTGRLCRRF